MSHELLRALFSVPCTVIPVRTKRRAQLGLHLILNFTTSCFPLKSDNFAEKRAGQKMNAEKMAWPVNKQDRRVLFRFATIVVDIFQCFQPFPKRITACSICMLIPFWNVNFKFGMGLERDLGFFSNVFLRLECGSFRWPACIANCGQPGHASQPASQLNGRQCSNKRSHFLWEAPNPNKESSFKRY